MIENFFASSSKGNRFEAYSPEHWVMIGFFLIGVLLLFLFRKKLKENVIRRTFFTVMLSLELGYHVWLVLSGRWDVSFALPLQLCSISLILCLILLVTNKKGVFEIVYFMGIAGAIQAVFTPELYYNFPHYRFLQFFINHSFIIWTCLFYVWTVGYRPNFFSIFKSFFFLNIVAGVAFVTNKFTGGNYMFLGKKPAQGSALDLLGTYPWYILSLEGVALLLFILLWLPFCKKKKEHYT